MSLSTKILIWIGAVLLIGTLGFIIFKQIENSNRQLAIQTQLVAQQQLIDGIVRSSNQWTTKEDLNKFITDNNVNLKAIQEDLSKLNATVTAANSVVANSNGQVATNVPSTNTGPKNPNPVVPGKCPDGTVCPNVDPFGYQQSEQDLALNEDFGTLKVPVGKVGFSAWQKDPWSIDIKPREYNVTNVVGTDPNQRLYFENKFTVKVDGKEYDVPIKTATTKQIYPTASWSWFNPRLYMGVDGAVGLTPVKGEFTPNLNVQIMSYGQYKTQPDFSILQVGAGYGTVSQRPQLVITPVAYNVGKHIPLMNNTYIGPSLSVGTDGNVFIGGGIRVGL
jgi:hypothetical protein